MKERKMNVRPGSGIEATLKRAVALASKSGVPVVFGWNDGEKRVEPGSSVEVELLRHQGASVRNLRQIPPS